MNEMVRVQRIPGYLASEMNGEKVVLSIAQGKYYSLGGIGGEVWDLIETPRSLREVVLNLTAQYEVSEEECSREVQSFIEQLEKEKMVRIERLA